MLEPQASNLVEVYKGANALEHGGATLGGAMNFVTKNGYNASPLSVKMEAGSFDYFNSSISSGFAAGKNDLFVSTSYSKSNGYRQYNSSNRFNALLNIGRKFSDKFESRLYASFTDLYFDIPGPLSRNQMNADRKQINAGPRPPQLGGLKDNYALGPNVVRDRPHRNSHIARSGSKSAYQINAHNLLTATLYYQYADDTFMYPINSSVRHDYNNDYGVKLNYDYTTAKNDLSIGVHLSQGKMHQLRRVNYRGYVSDLFAKQDLTAEHAVAYISDVYKITDKLLVNIAVQGSYDTRKVADLYDETTRPVLFIAPNPNVRMERVLRQAVGNKIDTDYSYNAVNPKAGLIYKLSDKAQVYGNYSLSYEPPTFLEIIRVNGGAVQTGTAPNLRFVLPGSSNPSSSPSQISAFELKAQKAQTAELGTKGNLGDALMWNVSAYYSWVTDEIFTISDRFMSINGITVNTPYGTVHRGAEVGVQSTFLKGNFGAFTAFVNYSYSDFFFDGGDYKGNQIAGIPKHYVYGALDYRHPVGFFAEVNAESLPEKTPIDHANTYYQEGYTLLGAKVGFKKGRWTFFVQGNNLADTVYASSYLVQDRMTPPPAQFRGATTDDKTVFIPGVGRKFVGGLNYTW